MVWIQLIAISLCIYVDEADVLALPVVCKLCTPSCTAQRTPPNRHHCHLHLPRSTTLTHMHPSVTQHRQTDRQTGRQAGSANALSAHIGDWMWDEVGVEIVARLPSDWRSSSWTSKEAAADSTRAVDDVKANQPTLCIHRNQYEICDGVAFTVWHHPCANTARVADTELISVTRREASCRLELTRTAVDRAVTGVSRRKEVDVERHVGGDTGGVYVLHGLQLDDITR